MALFPQEQTQIQTPRTVSIIESQFDNYTPERQQPQKITYQLQSTPAYVPIYLNQNSNLPIIALVSIVGILAFFGFLAYMRR